jgi:hypothetical protein
LIRQSLFWSLDAVVVINTEDKALIKHFSFEVFGVVDEVGPPYPLVLGRFLLESVD